MTEPTRKIALITGADRGIGFETAKELGQQGYVVLIGSRNVKRGQVAVEQLKALDIVADTLEIDVTDQQTVQRAADQISNTYQKLDVLINNAGIALPDDELPSTVSVDVLRQTFDTNFFGSFAVTQIMLPLIRKAKAGRIVSLSSSVGSLNWQSHPIEGAPINPAYAASKNGVNALTVMFARELKGTAIKVNAADPGWTATDLNGFNAPRSVAEGAQIVVKLATLPADGPSGQLISESGKIAW
ncbi:SDR family oxidoreductase [Levilactobacillus zymae]|uniref:SDR family oxidoreductase n=1 Tax=Levilactobacillus zymae TaxID=267363 RepID=UPI0028B91C4C|nr:SDR family oxidoreductase [Levilactobacillus zymae]MDT6980629.1 SDR family oxidoreductase [Levilactobacillus zymae]